MTSFVRVGRVLAMAFAVTRLAAPVVAQVSTFDLSGAVLDQSSAVLPGVTVSLKNTKTGLVRTEVTDERGAVSLHRPSGGG
jgi:hypothetical protein